MTVENAELEIERELFAAADQMRGAMEPSDYKHVALGLLFLKHISDKFEFKHAELENDPDSNPEDLDEYRSEHIFLIPQKAHWSYIQKQSKNPNIGKIIDEAMIEIEKTNKSLKDVLPKTFASPDLSAVMLGGLIDLFTNINFSANKHKSRDLLGRVYEYFLGEFAGAEGKRGGEFYTPRSVVRLLVEMLQPYKGRVYDPASGSGGMFILSEEFVKKHGGKVDDISIWGQEMNPTTWRLSKMNLALHGIDSDIAWNSEGTFHNNAFPNERFDFILANPPFNISGWGADRLAEDERWKYGIPSDRNANYAWLQHIVYHLSSNGTAGVVLANGSMSSEKSNEGNIRRALIEDDKIDCMVALPGQLFYSTQIPACLWFLAKNKNNRKLRKKTGEILFIDARKKGYMQNRTHRTFSDDDVVEISSTYHKWREGGDYEDVPGYCASVALDEIRENGFVLNPGRYIRVEEREDDGILFEEKFFAFES